MEKRKMCWQKLKQPFQVAVKGNRDFYVRDRNLLDGVCENEDRLGDVIRCFSLNRDPRCHISSIICPIDNQENPSVPIQSCAIDLRLFLYMRETVSS
jgi:hypothetical protein